MPNWEKIEHEYVTGSMSLRELARKHELSERTVMTRAHRGHWAQARERFNNKVKAEAQKLKAEREAVEAKAKAEAGVTDLEMLKDAVTLLLEKTMTAIRDCDKKYVGGRVVEVPIEPKNIKRLTSAVKDLADILGYTAVVEDENEGGIILMPVVMKEGD